MLTCLVSRSIPARAGEPTRLEPLKPTVTVYPRACGGTFGEEDFARLSGGLSPRVRGNRDDREQAEGAKRSIPARAGVIFEGMVDSPLDSIGRQTGHKMDPR